MCRINRYNRADGTERREQKRAKDKTWEQIKRQRSKDKIKKKKKENEDRMSDEMR